MISFKYPIAAAAALLLTQDSPRLAESYFPTRNAEKKNDTENTVKGHFYAGKPVALPEGRLSGDIIKELDNLAYTTGYNQSRNIAVWTCYRLFKQGDVGFNIKSSDSRKISFKVDSRTDAKIASSLYTNSGYDRGHMAPFDSVFSNYGEDAVRQTFLMSNICPQVRGFNRGIWKSIEATEVNVWANAYDEIWVICGPILGDRHISKKGKSVPVPEKFYKIYIDEDKADLRILALVFPNQKDSDRNLKNYITSVREIEQQTGLDFNSELPDSQEELLESRKADAVWPDNWKK